jgi:hypothetical protein
MSLPQIPFSVFWQLDSKGFPVFIIGSLIVKIKDL